MKTCWADDEPHTPGKITKGLCGKHYARFRRYGTPDPRPPWTNRWKGDEITYSAAHSRTRLTRGVARDYLCVECGHRAKDWAYDHGDPEERVDSNPNSQSFGRRYSVNPDHYIPMCRPCHVRFDKPSSAYCPNSHLWEDNARYLKTTGARYCRECARQGNRRQWEKKKASAQ